MLRIRNAQTSGTPQPLGPVRIMSGCDAVVSSDCSSTQAATGGLKVILKRYAKDAEVSE